MPVMFAACGVRFLAARRYQYLIDSTCTDDSFSCDMTGLCTGSTALSGATRGATAGALAIGATLAAALAV